MDGALGVQTTRVVRLFGALKRFLGVPHPLCLCSLRRFKMLFCLATSSRVRLLGVNHGTTGLMPHDVRGFAVAENLCHRSVFLLSTIPRTAVNFKSGQ